MGTQTSRDLKAMGPWVPMLVVIVVFLVVGIDISLGGANDDPRFGYLFLGLFGLTAAASYSWRRHPRAMAQFCLALIAVLCIMAGAALALNAIDFGLPVVVMLAVILGALGGAALMFRRPHSAGADTL